VVRRIHSAIDLLSTADIRADKSISNGVKKCDDRKETLVYAGKNYGIRVLV
jgi:hypothetical protein